MVGLSTGSDREVEGESQGWFLLPESIFKVGLVGISEKTLVVDEQYITGNGYR